MRPPAGAGALMPVRTQHGRAQVYRRVWGAPLRSPHRLALLAVAVLALVVWGWQSPPVRIVHQRSTQGLLARWSLLPPWLLSA